MERNERERQMSPAERRRRMEAKKRRQKERARKKRIRMLILIGMGAAAIALIGLIIFGIVKRVSGSGSSEIASKSGTFVIAIDPGHGGEDIGQSNGDSVEKNITLAICSKLKTMLEDQLGYQVIMLREEDLRLSKEERVQKVNESQADLLVSIHCGYSEDAGISGSVSYYKTDSKSSKDLANKIQEALVEVSSTADGGVKEGNFSIISNTEIPSVLIEVGYLSNFEEASNLSDDKYQSTIARGIATGIKNKLAKN